jgi:hypothetical protein
MDIAKLKIANFNNIVAINFPDDIEIKYPEYTNNTDVIIYFIREISDIKEFADLCKATDLPEKNRTILVFRKGIKGDVNRDTIITPFRDNTYTNFKLRAPMLCSLSDKLSAFVMSFERKQS